MRKWPWRKKVSGCKLESLAEQGCRSCWCPAMPVLLIRHYPQMVLFLEQL